jgi:DUF917 family protein
MARSTPADPESVAAASRELSYDELDLLATGAWILGTGGGGNPYYNLIAIKKLYREGYRVSLLQPEALADDDLVAMVSFQGAPLVNSERLPDPALMVKAIRVMEDHIGKSFAAVMSTEIGGSNGVQPLLAAAMMDIPLVDADAMGRAFPDISKTCFAVKDLTPYPLTVIDVRNNTAIIPEGADWFWMERISRQIVTEMGSTASTCKAPRTGREVKEHGILGSVTKAIRIGRVVSEARRAHRDPIADLLESEGGQVLFRGKVIDVNRRATGGFLRGDTTMEGLEDYRDQSFRLDFQNEFSIGTHDGAVRITVPDLICVLDSVSGEAIGTETIRYGQRVTVVAMPSPEVFLCEKGFRHAGPRAFGFDIDFVSLFERTG